MDFKLPDIGEGIHEGEITKWLVKVGDTIQADQPMVEVMTDKATVEIPSPVTGVVEKVNAKEGETIEVGKVLLTIKEAGKAAAAPTPAPEKKAPPPPPPQDQPKAAPAMGMQAARPEAHRAPPPPPPPSEEALPFELLATPATRKLARDLSIDLRGVKGSGPHGRVTKMDVQLAYEGQSAAAPRSSHSTATGMSVTTPSAKTAMAKTGTEQRIALKGIRKRIAEAMHHSKQTAAHFTYVEEVDMTAVVKLRKSAADEAKKRDTKLTFLPFIIKALIPALQEFPMLNASLDDEKQEIVVKNYFNFGIATDTPSGLIVPNIKGVERKTIWELAHDIHELGERARAGKSQLEDLRGGTFTLTNAGSIGGVFTTPVINHPEVAILGVNAIRKRPMVVDDEIVIRDMMYLSMSVDHRVVDGADAARFMNRLVYFLTEPTRLVFA